MEEEERREREDGEERVEELQVEPRLLERAGAGEPLAHRAEGGLEHPRAGGIVRLEREAAARGNAPRAATRRRAERAAAIAASASSESDAAVYCTRALSDAKPQPQVGEARTSRRASIRREASASGRRR